MRTALKNKQKLYYALKGAVTPVYELNSDGTIKYITVDGVQVPVETGSFEVGYEVPVEFLANINTSGDITSQEFGLSVSDYDALMVLEAGAIPITETSLIWHKSEIGYRDTAQLIVNPNTADYRVIAIRDSLNVRKYALKRITK